MANFFSEMISQFSNLKAPQKVLFLFLAGFLIFLLTRNTPLSTSVVTSPEPSAQQIASSSANPSPEATALSCLGEDKLSEVLGQKFILRNEEYLPEIQLLSCSYESDQQIKNLSPSVKYALQRSANSEQWQEAKDLVSKKAGYRTIVENPNIFAEINPVFEVNQGTFYGHSDKFYLEFSFTPIKLATGDILSRGVKASETLLAQ
jgi:hypothetical protein